LEHTHRVCPLGKIKTNLTSTDRLEGSLVLEGVIVGFSTARLHFYRDDKLL